jgi:hypothetical protein
MKKVFLFILSLALLLTVSIMPVTPVSATTNLTVDLSSVIGPATHVATGSLYGVIETKPSDSFISQIRPKVLTNPAVAGYQQPWGAAIPVAQRVAQYGTKVQIRLADWYTGWYDFSNMTDWFNKMATTVNAVKASGITNVYGYEIWNEPYYTWHLSESGMTFDEFYSLSHARLKQLDPNAKAIGPSWEYYDHNAMNGFLTYQKARNTIPDIICWHQLNNEDFTRDYNDYRALEQSLGISPRPITINEYSGEAWLSDEGRPGAVAPIIAKFERFKIDSACQSFLGCSEPGKIGKFTCNRHTAQRRILVLQVVCRDVRKYG